MTILEKDFAREKVVIADMRAPVLSEIQANALAMAAQYPVSLTEEGVLGAAQAETGLADFGADDFRERLRLWIAAAEADKSLTALARAGLWADMVRFAANRLRVEDAINRHPEILDIVIDRPLIVAGLPRSGTTYLQNFLGADDQLRSLPYWEALRPVPASPEENGDPATDPRFAKAVEAWAQMDAILPYIKMVHPFDPDHISEDIELQCLDFGSYNLDWHVPSQIWQDHYWSMDHSGVYRYMKRVLQVLTFFKGPNRWLLKCPQHLEQLPALYSVFPDATFVLMHRDPIASIQSAITSIGYSSRIRVEKVEPQKIADFWIARYEKLLRACVAGRDILPEGQVEDILFDALLADPMGIVERIYAKAQLPLSDALRARMERFVAENKRGKHGSLDYDLRRDFGLDPADIRRRFAFYFDRFAVRTEVQ